MKIPSTTTTCCEITAVKLPQLNHLWGQISAKLKRVRYSVELGDFQDDAVRKFCRIDQTTEILFMIAMLVVEDILNGFLWSLEYFKESSLL